MLLKFCWEYTSSLYSWCVGNYFSQTILLWHDDICVWWEVPFTIVFKLQYSSGWISLFWSTLSHMKFSWTYLPCNIVAVMLLTLMRSIVSTCRCWVKHLMTIIWTLQQLYGILWCVHPKIKNGMLGMLKRMTGVCIQCSTSIISNQGCNLLHCWSTNRSAC